jgi:hypothetical protein
MRVEFSVATAEAGDLTTQEGAGAGGRADGRRADETGGGSAVMVMLNKDLGRGSWHRRRARRKGKG